jgi:hypothetical protein
LLFQAAPTFHWNPIPNEGPLSPPAAESTANNAAGFHTADSSLLETTVGNVQLQNQQIEVVRTLFDVLPIFMNRHQTSTSMF